MAQDDLRYPEHLIASPHEERPQSDLPVQVGSMPGKPLQEVKEGEEDVLISGRGLIP